MEAFEILCVTIHRECKQEIFIDLFRRILKLDDHFDCVPPVRYQLHGLQKAADPIQLFIFCSDKTDVIQTFRQKSEFNVVSILPASLTYVWRQVDRWNLVNCICWLDGHLLTNDDRIKKKLQLFLACIPPSTIGSSVYVVPNERLSEVVKEDLAHLKLAPKSPNVTQTNMLHKCLSILWKERLTAVRNNTSLVLDHVKSEVLSRDMLDKTITKLPETHFETHGTRAMLSPVYEDIINFLIKENPKVDIKLLEGSVNTVLERQRHRHCIMVLLQVFASICVICLRQSCILLILSPALILLLFKSALEMTYEKDTIIYNVICKYNESIYKLHKTIEHIDDLFTKHLSHDVEGCENMNTIALKHDNIVTPWKEWCRVRRRV